MYALDGSRGVAVIVLSFLVMRRAENAYKNMVLSLIRVVLRNLSDFFAIFVGN